MNQSIAELIEARRQKYEARKIFYYHIRTGKIIRQTVCSVCGKSNNIHAHHADYSKPLKVIWLCTKCHGLAHRKRNLLNKCIVKTV